MCRPCQVGPAQQLGLRTDHVHSACMPSTWGQKGTGSWRAHLESRCPARRAGGRPALLAQPRSTAAAAFLSGRRLACHRRGSSSGSGASSGGPPHAAPRGGRRPALRVKASGEHGHYAHPNLEDLQMMSVVNVQGYIMPEVPAGTEATVFAIYEQGKSLQVCSA